MTGKPRPKPDDPEQSRRFIDAAMEAGVDETGEAFEAAIKKIVPERGGQENGTNARRSRVSK